MEKGQYDWTKSKRVVRQKWVQIVYETGDGYPEMSKTKLKQIEYSRTNNKYGVKFTTEETEKFFFTEVL